MSELNPILVTDKNRESLIILVKRSFQVMPKWVRSATAHHLFGWIGVQHDGKTIDQAIKDSNMSNADLEAFINDIDDNGDLLPETSQ